MIIYGTENQAVTVKNLGVKEQEPQCGRDLGDVGIDRGGPVTAPYFQALGSNPCSTAPGCVAFGKASSAVTVWIRGNARKTPHPTESAPLEMVPLVLL